MGGLAWRARGTGEGELGQERAWRKSQEERGRGSTLRTGWMTSTALRTEKKRPVALRMEKKRTVERGYQCGAAAPGHPDFKERGTLK